MKLPVYLDYQATTPVDPRVVEAMLPYLKDKFGNIGSSHLCGRDVVGPVALARQHMANLIGAKAKEIIFTSGATESDNLAIKGVASARRELGRHIITQETEHKAVLDTCRYLETQGFEVTFLKVDSFGKIRPEQVKSALRMGREGTVERTILVSIMGANNEIGTLQPIKEIGAILAGRGVIFHVDAAQTVGKVPFNVNELGVDLAAISAHKMYGPKGIGCLYVRQGVELDCQMHGGGQECGYRSGTLAVPMAVALGEAARLAREELEHEVVELARMRDLLQSGLETKLNGTRINGHPSERLPGNLSITFDDIDGERLLLGLNQVCCSATSACSSASLKPSYVLKAIGLSDRQALSTVRLGLGRFTTDEEVDFAINHIVSAVQALRGPPA